MKKNQNIIIIILLGISIFFMNSIYITKNEVAFAATTGTVTASSLNVREGAGTNYKVVKKNGKYVMLKKGTSVTILNNKNNWYQISAKYNGSTIKGYVIKTYIKQTSSSNTVKALSTTSNLNIPAVVTASTLKVRVGASTKNAQLTMDSKNVSLLKSTKVTILKEKKVNNEKWYYISFLFNKKTGKGYVHSDYIKLTLASSVNAVISSSSSIKIRTGAGTTKAYLTDSNKKVVSLKNGVAVTITKEITTSGNKWYGVSFTYNKKKMNGYLLSNSTILKSVVKNNDTDDNTNNSDDTNNSSDNSDNTNNNSNTDNNTDNSGGTGSNNDQTTNPTNKIGIVKDTDTLNVRTGAGTSNAKLTYNGNNVTLSQGTQVTIYDETMVGTVTWYHVKFDYNGVELSGYVSGYYIDVTTTGGSTPNNPSDNPTAPSDNTGILTDEEFETSLNNENFPESYKVLLRKLHSQYPYWIFEGYNTGLDWSTAVAKESRVGVNLITNSKDIDWKSLESGAYDYKTDRFIPFDGSTWVTASKKAVEYYMDPRNFLTASKIYQFESLCYQKAYQTLAGVENILYNTPLYQTSYTYLDKSTNKTNTKTYGETFLEAADYSGVSPYHLATRSKQEVISSKNTMSQSITGTVTGYEGLYNFYNIGATHSTVSGGALVNALNYSKKGTTNSGLNKLYLIPWDNIYNSIVGGAKFIGSSYIERGQNTVYLQKFNMTPISTYSHQYMANVEAASSEASKTYIAYSSMTNVPIVFTIPIYNNMPATACPVPEKVLNPNNWLKTLSIVDYTLTPSFDLTKDQTYSLIVEKDVESVEIKATPVSTKASVKGTGLITLNTGKNTVTITVAAENGTERDYTINIVREE